MKCSKIDYGTDCKILCTENHWTVQFKCVNYVVCELYFNKLLPLKGQFLDSAYELDYASIHPEGHSSWDTHIKNIWPIRNTGQIGASLYLETFLILWVWWQESSLIMLI